MAKQIALALLLVIVVIFCIEYLLIFAVADNPRDKRSSMCVSVLLGVLAAIIFCTLCFSGGTPG